MERDDGVDGGIGLRGGEDHPTGADLPQFCREQRFCNEQCLHGLVLFNVACREDGEIRFPVRHRHGIILLLGVVFPIPKGRAFAVLRACRRLCEPV